MATEVKSQQDYYTIAQNQVQTQAPELTDFTEGSSNDVIAGVVSTAAAEISKLIIDKFNKTYLNTAHGPEVTGGDDDLQTLAVDHFGDSFARPGASKAVGVVNFTRPNAAAGNVIIPVGTIVKTKKNANGEEQRFATEATVTMTGTSINASVKAVEGGTAGNVSAASVIVVESSLTDPTVVVTNSLGFTGGAAAMNDAEYREFIRNKVEIIRGATKTAIEAAANNVAGVEKATAIEILQAVIEWDIGLEVTIGSYFMIPRVKLYIADANGTASQALIDLVEAAVFPVRAFGVRVEVLGANPLPMDWSASISLNPFGPNFAEFSSDPSRIVQTMEQYIKDLAIGTGFDRGLARLAMLDIWGPAGTDDLTDFVTNVPSGNITASVNDKLIPDTVEIV